MRKALAFIVAAVSIVSAADAASAQNLVITNARILDGAGGVIDRGSLVVRDGKIVSVSSGVVQPPPGARTIDARGRTVMPGFIDAHRHIIQGDPAQWLEQQAPARMQDFLDAGFTTVLSAGDAAEPVLELRKRTAAGTIKGPRIFAAGRVPLARPAAPPGAQAAGAPPTAGAAAGAPRRDPARFDVSRPPLRPTTPAAAIPADETVKTVESVAKAGFDFIKTAITATPGGPETRTLQLVVQEGKKRNLPTITHAVTVIDTLAAVEAGPAVLVHTPHIGRLEEDAAAVQRIAKAGIPMTSTLAIFIPHFDAEGKPLFRDRLPFPWDTISSAGQGPVNARLLWEAGISYGYGTDTSWPPKESLADELRALQLTFSPRDIVSIMTRNAARSVLKADLLGTLEPGKLADIVIVEGDPLTNVASLLNVTMTIKGGVVVSERTATTSSQQ
jgi:imidazolonepropionase-like amidohydrolase